MGIKPALNRITREVNIDRLLLILIDLIIIIIFCYYIVKNIRLFFIK